MKAIQGYVTEDGQFFEDKLEADLHERTVAMKAILQADDMSEDVLDWINRRQKEIANYLRIEVNERRYVLDKKNVK